MASGLLSLKWNNHKSTFFQVLSTVRSKETYCDVTLACDGNFYPLHKFVLSTCSEYFEKMFEKTECKHPIIVLKDIKADELEALLNYMYIGEVNVVQEKLSGLIKAAECLQIKGLAVPDEEPIKHNQFSEPQKRPRVRHEESPRSKRRKRSSEFDGDVVNLNKKIPISELEHFSEPVQSQDSLPSPHVTSNESKTTKYSHDPEDSTDEIIVEENVVKTEIIDPENQEGLDVNMEDKNSLYKQLALDHSNTDDGPYIDANALLANSDSIHDSMAGVSGYQPANFPQWEGDGSLSNFPMEAFTGDSDAQNQQLIIATSGSPDSRRPCPYCSKTFGSTTDFKRHILIHENRKPYACPFCSYEGRRSEHLRKHTLSNHVLKGHSFQCSMSQLRSFTRDQLYTVLRTRLTVSVDGQPLTEQIVKALVVSSAS